MTIFDGKTRLSQSWQVLYSVKQLPLEKNIKMDEKVKLFLTVERMME